MTARLRGSFAETWVVFADVPYYDIHRPAADDVTAAQWHDSQQMLGYEDRWIVVKSLALK